MKRHIIAFASVTYANKAKAVFSRYGIRSEIRRTPAGVAHGCGYSVIAEGCAERLAAVMDENGISYRSVSEYRDGRMKG